MCGIFAHYSYHVSLRRQQILDLLAQALTRLEYKGLDSCGLALEQGGAGPEAPCTQVVVRSVGGVRDLVAKADKELAEAGVLLAEQVECHTALAHTRWATHGQVTEQNAHPIASDARNTFLVVHNGLIENVKALRSVLTGAGERLETDTDTEVFAKLLTYCLRKRRAAGGSAPSFVDLVQQVLDDVLGAYAIVVTSAEHYPGEIVACAKGSPLMFAVKRSSECDAATFQRWPRRRRSADANVTPAVATGNVAAFLECVVSSDACAMAEHSANACVLADGDVLHLAGAGWTLHNACHEAGAEGALLPRIFKL